MAKRGEETVLHGGKRPQLRKPAARDWTKAKAARFLEALANSCNVKMAAAAAGVHKCTVYDRRRKDAEFRAGWARALAAAYGQLELMMLERALHGVEKQVVTKAGETSVMREYNDRVALALLKMHRDGAAAAEEEIGPGQYEEACARILARLEKLRARRAGPVETKFAGDRIALIAWALRQVAGWQVVGRK